MLHCEFICQIKTWVRERYSQWTYDLFEWTTTVRWVARLAQSVEHETLNLGVVGSSPTLGDYFESRSITRNGDCLDTNENRNAPSGTSCKRVGILFIVIARPLQTDFHTLLYYTFSSTNIMVCECQKRFLLKPFKPIKYVFGGKIIVFDKNALRVCQDSNLESSDP